MLVEVCDVNVCLQAARLLIRRGIPSRRFAFPVALRKSARRETSHLRKCGKAGDGGIRSQIIGYINITLSTVYSALFRCHDIYA